MSKKKFCLWLGLVLFLVAAMSSQAFAAFRLTTCSLDHRQTQGAKAVNRLWFALQDGAGNFATADDPGMTVTLKNTSVTPVKDISASLAGKQGPLKEFSFNGNWDGQQFQYDGVLYHLWQYTYDVNTTLTTGTYTLTVTYLGNTTSKQIPFTAMPAGVSLPAVVSSTITRKSFDNQGNLICMWNVTGVIQSFMEANRLSNPSLKVGAGVKIEVYQGADPEVKAFLLVRVPVHMGCVFVPAKIVTLLKTYGDTYNLSLQLRTNDNCNRYYSLAVPLTL